MRLLLASFFGRQPYAALIEAPLLPPAAIS
jgi:hypothetical protein